MAKQKELAISVKDLHKTFKLPHEQHSGVKQAIINIFRKNRKKGYEIQHVLKGLEFEIEKGDFFGIVGRNGSGKSTLLKLLAGIYTPDKGEIQVDGSLIPFIELGVGFNPDLTGRENVFLNGALLGFSRSEMEAMYDGIVEFAELEKFMDQKLKNYSSGMQVRLAFSIAIRADGDILLLDEVLAVGDEAFQRKCNDYFDTLKKSRKTVILVTHSMESVRKYCNKALLLKDGLVEYTGDPNKIADEYSGLNLITTKKKAESVSEKKPQLSAEITGKRLLHPSDKLELKISYKALNSQPVFLKAYIEASGYSVMATNPKLEGWKTMITSDEKIHNAVYRLNLKDFNKGEFKVIVLLEDVETGVNIASYGHENETLIKIENPNKKSAGGVYKNQASMELVHGEEAKSR